MLRVESCQFAATAPAFNLPHLHLVPLLGVNPFEFCRDFWHQTSRVPGLSCSIVCVILRLAVSVEHRLVTNERRADTRQQLIPTLAKDGSAIIMLILKDNVHGAVVMA